MLAACVRAALRTTAAEGGAAPLGRSLRRAASTEPSSPAGSAFSTRATLATPLPGPSSSSSSYGPGEQRPNEILIEAVASGSTSSEGSSSSAAGGSMPSPSSSSASPTGNPTAYPSMPTLPPLPTPPAHGGGPSATAGGSSSSPPFARPPHPHPFDTHSIVKHLEAAGFSHDASREVMRATRELVLRRTEQARSELLGKEDMENQAYLFKAALSELRTLLSLRTRNGQASVRSLTLSAEREVEGLGDRIKEGVEQLKHEIDIELENRKADTRSEQKAYEIAIEELNNKFTISLGDLRTDIEQYKWEATRKGIVVIATGVLFFVGSTLLFSQEPPPPPPPVLLPPVGAARTSGSGASGKKRAGGGSSGGAGWLGDEDEGASAEGGREVLGGVEGAP